MAAGKLDLTSSVADGVGIVVVHGEVDLDTVGQLVDAVAAATPPGGRVEIDLRDVAFIDSAGVAGLNRCRRQAVRVESEVVVLCVQDGAVAKLLNWTGLARVVEVRAETTS